MESSSTRTLHFWWYRNFSPSHAEEVEDPEVIQVTDPLSSIDHQVWIEQLCGVIGSGPGCGFVSFGTNLDPLFGLPVEQADCVEPLLVGASSAEEDQSIVVLIVVHGAVGAQRWDVAGGLHFIPLHGDGVEAPEVVHVAGVYVGQ